MHLFGGLFGFAAFRAFVVTEPPPARLGTFTRPEVRLAALVAGLLEYPHATLQMSISMPKRSQSARSWIRTSV